MKINTGKPFSGIKKLSKEQQKIIYAGLIILASLVFFWLFIYLPQSRKFSAIKDKLARTEDEIRRITALTGGKDLSAAVGSLKAELLKAAAQLPDGDEEVISALSESARKLKIQVKNIVPSEAKSLGDKVPGYDIREMPISLSLSGEFRAIGNYLDALRNNCPILIRVRDIQIQGKGEGQPDLGAVLQLSAYLAAEKK